MGHPAPHDDFEEMRDAICEVVQHLNEGHQVTTEAVLDLTSVDRLMLWVSDKDAQFGFKDLFAADLNWAVEHRYLTYAVEDGKGAITLGSNAGELKCS